MRSQIKKLSNGQFGYTDNGYLYVLSIKDEYDLKMFEDPYAQVYYKVELPVLLFCTDDFNIFDEHPKNGENFVGERENFNSRWISIKDVQKKLDEAKYEIGEYWWFSGNKFKVDNK